MKDGFLRVGAASPKIRVADIDFNAEQIISCVKNADKDCALLVFPELCVTGCTCGDLFRQEAFIDHAWEALYRIAEETSDAPQVFIIGLPAYIEGKLLNLAVVLDEEISFGQPLYFSDNDLFSFGVIFDEDLRAPISDDVDMALAGCQIIATLSSRPYIVGATEKTSSLLSAQSRKLHAAYIYANAGLGESTTDLVFAGTNFIYENGKKLSESRPFSEDAIYTDLDLKLLSGERLRDDAWRTDFANTSSDSDFDIVTFPMDLPYELSLIRKVPKNPFAPEDPKEIAERCEQILTIQAMALVTRMNHIHSKKVIVGLSGGLDSTLAFLVSARAFDIMGLPKSDIHAITMPCFGTTSRTKNNSIELAKAYDPAF